MKALSHCARSNPFQSSRCSTPSRTAPVSTKALKFAVKTRATAVRNAESTVSWPDVAGKSVCTAALAVALALDCTGNVAWAAGRKQPPITESATRCDVSALDKFADTRAKFSQESAGGNMTEAIVDVRNCDFSNQDLSGKVFSAVMLQGADLSNSKVIGSQFARADAKGAVLVNTDFTDTNCYGTSFDGADVSGAQFENSILTGATFGKDATGTWANLKGAHFEGALLSTSDIGRICENPTLEESTKKFELGCRAAN